MKSRKEPRSMSELNIGNQILVGINHQGQRIYEPIYLFIHARPNGLYDYLKISIEHNSEK
jgi:hypothetical protein